MSLFRHPNAAMEILPQPIRLQEIYAALKKLHNHKVIQNAKLVGKYRDLEELRNDLLLIANENIAAHLDNTPENYRLCRQEITLLLTNNIQQTKNYICEPRKEKILEEISLGAVHQLCASLMPEALIDALIIMRSRPMPKIIRVKQSINPNTKETIQTREVRRPRHDIMLVDYCLKNLDEKTTTLIKADQRIQTLLEEVNIENFFATLDISQYANDLQSVFAEAKALHHDFLCDHMAISQYDKFKQQVIEIAASSKVAAANYLRNFITHMEKMLVINEYGRELTALAQHNSPFVYHD